MYSIVFKFRQQNKRRNLLLNGTDIAQDSAKNNQRRCQERNDRRIVKVASNRSLHIQKSRIFSVWYHARIQLFKHICLKHETKEA